MVFRSVFPKLQLTNQIFRKSLRVRAKEHKFWQLPASL